MDSFLIRRIDGVHWLAFIMFGSCGLVNRGLRAQNAIFIPNKYTQATDVTASINAGHINVCVLVSVRYCDQSTLFIHPCCCLPSGGVITHARTHARAGHTQTRRGALMFGLVSTNDWVWRGGGVRRGSILWQHLWVCPVTVSRRCCFGLVQIAALSFNSLFRLQNHRTRCTVTHLPNLSVLCTVCVCVCVFSKSCNMTGINFEWTWNQKKKSC